MKRTVRKTFVLRDITRLPGDPLRQVVGGKLVGVTKWSNTPSDGSNEASASGPLKS